MHVEYHPAIEQELREIIDYYNVCSEGLGVEFLNELERQVLKIASLPTQWRVVEGDLRRALMQRFPYVIYYRILENDVLRVTLVKHQRRHPGYGLDRK
jgi:plasmid stabilization system protein ParE